MGFPVMKKLEEYEHFIIPIGNVSICIFCKKQSLKSTNLKLTWYIKIKY